MFPRTAEVKDVILESRLYMIQKLKRQERAFYKTLKDPEEQPQMSSQQQPPLNEEPQEGSTGEETESEAAKKKKRKKQTIITMKKNSKSKNKSATSNQTVQRKEQFLIMDPSLESEDPVLPWAFRYDTTCASHVSQIDELLRCPDDPGPELTLQLTQRDLVVPKAKEKNPIVAVRFYALDYTGYYRIGYFRKPNKPSTTEVELERQLPPQYRSIPSVDVYLWRNEREPVLVHIPAWRLRKFIIYDMDKATDVRTTGKRLFPSGMIWDDPYNDQDTSKSYYEMSTEFIERLKAGKTPGVRLGDSKVDRPMYCFHDKLPGGLGVAEFPSPYITAALHFINHLPTGGAPVFKFKSDVELLIDKDDYQDVRQAIFDDLKAQVGVQAFFAHQKRKAMEWDVQLWVLIQSRINALSFMYRYDEERSIRDFLHPITAGQKRDFRIFMAVHIVPMAKQQTTRS